MDRMAARIRREALALIERLSTSDENERAKDHYVQWAEQLRREMIGRGLLSDVPVTDEDRQKWRAECTGIAHWTIAVGTNLDYLRGVLVRFRGQFVEDEDEILKEAHRFFYKTVNRVTRKLVRSTS